MRKPNVLISCTYCGQPTTKWAYQIKKDKNHFCCVGCHYKWISTNLVGDKSPGWKGGNYTKLAQVLQRTRYRKLRKYVIALDNNKCTTCNSIIRLEIHHIIEKNKDVSLIYDVTNMITLCHKCHCGIYGREGNYIGIFNDVIAKRVNSGKPRTGNPEPSVQSTKVQRLLEYSDILNNQISALHESDDIVQAR